MHANEPVNRVMSQPVLSIEVDAPASEMIHTFLAYPVHHLPVVKRKFVVGMLSSADLAKVEFFLPTPGPARDAVLNRHFRVDQLMRTPVISIGEHESIQRAAELMVTNAIHSLPVVNRLHHLIGIVTTTDLMQCCLHTDATATHRNESRVADERRTDSPASEPLSTVDDQQELDAKLTYLQWRVHALESVAWEAKRFLNAGQDERLHTSLIKAIESAERTEQMPAIL